MDKDMLRYERMLWQQGVKYVAGVDEAGRGPLAGPVAAACVVLNPDKIPEGADDSKKLTEKKREQLYDIILRDAVSVSVKLVSAAEIDEINILQATFKAMNAAIDGISVVPGAILIDGDKLPRTGPGIRAIVGGDGKSATIACASIIAKVTRDRLLKQLDGQYPQYGFAKHKGYGTAAHYEAIREYGLCPEHRRSFCTRIKPGGGLRARGAAAEDVAARYITELGFTVKERNYNARTGEIDIIATESGQTVFIEVKQRSGPEHGLAQEAVTLKKQRALRSAALRYMQQNGLMDSAVRFDCVAINGDEIEIIKNAF